MSWVKVSDRLPDEGEYVHCYNLEEEIYYGVMYYDDFSDEQGFRDNNGVLNAGLDSAPTHWCSAVDLPDFPTEGEII